MPRRKKRKLSQSENVFDISAHPPLFVPPYPIADEPPPGKKCRLVRFHVRFAEVESCKEVIFRVDRILNADTANKTGEYLSFPAYPSFELAERSLLKLLERICTKYSGYYQTYNQVR